MARPPKLGRNEPCACGSGRKFKRCCRLRLPGAAVRRGDLVLPPGMRAIVAEGAARA